MNNAQKLLISKQKNDLNNIGGNRNLSVEQAAKNLKLSSGEDVMQAPTRNSNLLSHPNKDKLAKNKANIDVAEEGSNRGVGGLNFQNKKDIITQSN